MLRQLRRCIPLQKVGCTGCASHFLVATHFTTRGVRILRCGLRAHSSPTLSYSPALHHLRCNHNDTTTNTVDPSSINVEMALTSGVTPNLIIE